MQTCEVNWCSWETDVFVPVIHVQRSCNTIRMLDEALSYLCRGGNKVKPMMSSLLPDRESGQLFWGQWSLHADGLWTMDMEQLHLLVS